MSRETHVSHRNDTGRLSAPGHKLGDVFWRLTDAHAWGCRGLAPQRAKARMEVLRVGAMQSQPYLSRGALLNGFQVGEGPPYDHSLADQIVGWNKTPVAAIAAVSRVVAEYEVTILGYVTLGGVFETSLS